MNAVKIQNNFPRIGIKTSTKFEMILNYQYNSVSYLCDKKFTQVNFVVDGEPVQTECTTATLASIGSLRGSIESKISNDMTSSNKIRKSNLSNAIKGKMTLISE